MKQRLLPVCLVCCLSASSQVVQYAPSLPFNFLVNQAGLAELQQAGVGFFTERRFGLKELALHVAAAAMPIKGGGVGVALQYSGFAAFNEGRASLAYAKRLGRISLGVQFNYTRLSIGGGAVGAEVSGRWMVADKLAAGVRVVTGGRFQQAENEKVPAVYQMGLVYRASDQVCIHADLMKEEDRPLNVVAGVQYNIEQLSLRLGIATATGEPFFSAGWQWRNCRLEAAMRYHPQLGFSPGLVLVFWQKQKTEL